MQRYTEGSVKPTSFRLPRQLLSRVEQEARFRSMTITALTAELLDEGLKTRRFPGIVYRDGPTGRRAAVSGGPDVWEIIRAVRGRPERGERAVQAVAKGAGLTPDMVRLAVDFYATFPDEVDARIELDEKTAEQVRAAVERREKLLSA